MIRILFILAACAPLLSEAAVRPNIVTVFIDDMGWTDLSCFRGDHVKTENIDRLAAEGILFTNFYVNSPICSPSRVALTTGQYPQRWRITSYLNNRRSNLNRGMAQWLDPGAPVLARELQKNGYATGHFGKWHMGGQRDVDDAPPISAYGFDRSLTNFEGMGPKLLPLTLKPGQDPSTPGRIWQNAVRLGEGVTWMQRSHITRGFVDAALAFIEEARGQEKPFFVNLWPDDVHSPFFPPLDKWGDGGRRAIYYGVLDAMDEQLGPLFDRIRNDPELRQNTLILIASDNGHETGAGKSDPLRGAKTWLYEGGIRSPLIVWGPGLMSQQAAGRANTTSILSSLDLNRSLYSLCSTGLPAGTTLDGEDLGPTLLGREKKSRSAPLFWRRPPDRPGFGHGLQEDNPDLAVRDGRWKFLVNYDGSDPQLYHIGKDPGERHNVAETFPKVVERLRASLEEWNSTLPQDAGFPKANGKPVPTSKFINPIGEGADPWVIRDAKNKRYLWCFTEGNRGICIYSSESLTSLGEKHFVWTAPEDGPYAREVWAPELHLLDGRWHIYFAASDGRNENHLTYVLRSRDEDPLGSYELHGPLATGDGEDGRSPNLWAIDMTPLEFRGNRYALWSGWDAPGTDRQFLYIAPLRSPTELSGPRVRLCPNDDYPWEFTEGNGKGRGLNEAPQVLQSGERTFVTYSCGASWLPSYKVGLLELKGEDPLDPASWTKHENPVFQATEQTSGVGHSCFVRSPDARQWWHVFHAKRDRNPGWRRAVFVQPMHFRKDGFPEFSSPTAPGSPLDRPGGERIHRIPFVGDYSIPEFYPGFWPWHEWSYYGHHQMIRGGTHGPLLGSPRGQPVNLYRCGEKLVLNHAPAPDCHISVNIEFHALDGREYRSLRDAGILFRTSGPSVGYDAQRGYFAGLIPQTDLVILGATDGETWRELARAPSRVEPGKRHELEVETRGNDITVWHNGEKKINLQDSTYPAGTVGLRIVDSIAEFSNFYLESRPPAQPPSRPAASRDAPALKLEPPAPSEVGAVLLSGGFLGDDLGNWLPFGGNWRSRNGELMVNNAENGPRLLAKKLNLANFDLEVDIMVDDESQAGVVFRVDHAGTGIDAYRGYYAGLHGAKQRVMWGAALPGWKEIARRNTPVAPDKWHQLRVEARGESVRIFLNGEKRIEGTDARLKAGLLGFRSLGNKARFRNLVVTAN